MAIKAVLFGSVLSAIALSGCAYEPYYPQVVQPGTPYVAAPYGYAYPAPAQPYAYGYGYGYIEPRHYYREHSYREGGYGEWHHHGR